MLVSGCKVCSIIARKPFQRLHGGRIRTAVFVVGAGDIPLAEHFIDEADMIAGRIGIHETVSGGAQSLYKLGESLEGLSKA